MRLTNMASSIYKARQATKKSLGPDLTVLSLGAGVQSTTIALMCLHGEIEVPHAAIFADTQWEPKAVYEHLKWLRSGILPFPVHVVTAGNLREDVLKKQNSTGHKFDPVPWWTVDKDGVVGMGKRQCTSEYKLKPIAREVRVLLNKSSKDRIRKGAVRMILGISIDEADRMKVSRVSYIVNTYPLVEKGMSRLDCLNWLKDHGYSTPPRSACIACPFRSNVEWNSIRSNPEEWQDAIAVDASLRVGGKPGITSFAHFSRVPLGEADLVVSKQPPNLFSNECEGMCGV